MLQGTHGIWKRLPFARMLILFFSGIIIDKYVNVPFIVYCSIALSILLTIVTLEYLPLRYQWRLKKLRGSCIVLLILLFGSLNNNITSQKTTSAQSGSDIDSSTYLLLNINSEARSGDKSIRYSATIFQPQQSRYINKGNCFLYLKKISSDPIEKGDLIMTLEKPQRLASTSNPGAFDFSSYAHQQQVSYTLYMDNDLHYVRLRNAGDESNSIIEKIRKKILFILRNTIKDNTQIGLAEAMLIGYREDLDKGLLKTYVDTGVVHVIAISGLHLGLIFMLIELGVKSIFGKKRAVVAGILITIPLLWTFAILTGSSSSVNRSALMFTVLILGRVISKRNNSLNALCASAFILLFYNPNLITDLGFQLSYAAVGSILLFEKNINKLVFLKNKIAVYLWNMISITLAAQILTTPLVIMHFHRFPTLFLFSNLVAVPLSSLILILEIALCVFYMLNINFGLLVDVIEQLMEWMNGYIGSMAKIPFGMIDDIYISNVYIVTSCLFLGSLVCLIKSASKKTYWITCTLLLFLSFIRCIEYLILVNEKNIIVLNLRQTTALVVQHGENGVLAISNNRSEDTTTIRRLMKETGNGTGIEKWKIRFLPEKPFILYISEDVIENTRCKRTEKALLIAGDPGSSLMEMGIANANAEKIIADGSNKLWKIRQWEKEAYGLHLPLHSTAENGPYTIKIR
ncbi:MAG: ComEC/Rec2 family competence protein [bacterium]